MKIKILMLFGNNFQSGLCNVLNNMFENNSIFIFKEIKQSVSNRFAKSLTIDRICEAASESSVDSEHTDEDSNSCSEVTVKVSVEYGIAYL